MQLHVYYGSFMNINSDVKMYYYLLLWATHGLNNCYTMQEEWLSTSFALQTCYDHVATRPDIQQSRERCVYHFMKEYFV
jgi:hypothetical protein